MICEHCGQEIVNLKATEVRINGMYDVHLFHNFREKSIEEIISSWKEHNHPELGKVVLCPAVVMSGKKELRRVGKMVFYDNYKESDIQNYIDDIKNDPDITRLLSERT